MFKSVRFAARQLFVPSNLNAAPLGKSIRDIVTSINRSQPVFDARPMMDRVHELGHPTASQFSFFRHGFPRIVPRASIRSWFFAQNEI